LYGASEAFARIRGVCHVVAAQVFDSTKQNLFGPFFLLQTGRAEAPLHE
jgi:hypothetical protein